MFKKLKQFVSQPTNELGKWSRFAVLQVRIWFHCLRLLRVNRCDTQAAALAYHTIFGLVPLTIVTLMVFQMFPAYRDMGDKIKTFIYRQMNLSSIEYPVQRQADEDLAAGEDDVKQKTISVAAKLDELVQTYISKTHTGAVTAVGMALIIWAAIRLLTTTERAFNNIYHVGTGRSFLHRLFNYWALLTLGPILLGLGLYVSTKHLFASGTVQQIFEFLAPIVPFLISILAFFFLYFFLPNTRVSAKAAWWGAFVAALIWMGAKAAFSAYVTKFVPQFAVYGVLGIIPLTVLWIFLSWLIVLFGLQLTYATQNIKRLDAAEFDKSRRQEKCFLANDQTVIRVMEYILNAFERKDQKPVSVEAVAYRLEMPTDFTEKILNRLVQTGLLCHTNEPTVGYVPSTDGEHITLDEISRAICEVSFAQPSGAETNNMQQIFDELQRHLSRYTLKQVLNKNETFDVQFDSRPSPYEGEGGRSA